jgi:hypothetical protein
MRTVMTHDNKRDRFRETRNRHLICCRNRQCDARNAPVWKRRNLLASGACGESRQVGKDFLVRPGGDPINKFASMIRRNFMVIFF